MSDLADFLLARYDDDDALLGHDLEYIGDPWALFQWGYEIDLNNPRLRADCEAKRQIVAVLTEHPEDYGIGQATAEHLLKILTAPFSSHPDFRPEWRTET